MGLFVVERVPLVFQQAAYMRAHTALRVMALCGENKTQAMLDALRDGGYDVLCVTAGALRELIAGDKVDARMFCCVVVDECHHTTHGHPYVSVVESLLKLPVQARPRILGLTASPVAEKTLERATVRAQELCRRFACTSLMRPDLTAEPEYTVTWRVVARSEAQKEALRDIATALTDLATSINTTAGEDILPCKPITVEALRTDPGALGRLRGLARAVRDMLQYEQRSFADEQCAKLGRFISLISAAEMVDCMGTSVARIFAQESSLGATWPDDEKSTMLDALEQEIATCAAHRILVFLDTRDIATRLTAHLRAHPSIGGQYRPDIIVGHGGFDGMNWEAGQKEILAAFRAGDTRLLCTTSVLEEGLDVAECDLVLRFQGVKSLASFVQSRGRARAATAKMVVFLQEEHQNVAQEMENREKIMLCVCRRMAEVEGVPSEQTRERIRHLTDPNADLGVEPDTTWCEVRAESSMVLEVIVHRASPSHTVQDVVIRHFAQELRLDLLRAEVLSGHAALRQIGVDACGHHSRVVLLGFEPTWGDPVASYQDFCARGSFALTGGLATEGGTCARGDAQGIWCRLATEAPEECKQEWWMEAIDAGELSDPSTFMRRGRVVQRGVPVECESDTETLFLSSGALWIGIPFGILGSFALASWGHECVILYLLLNSAPNVYEEIPSDTQPGEVEYRRAAHGHPAVAALAGNFVLAVHLRGASTALRHVLSRSYLVPVPVFDARIAVLDAVSPQWSIAEPFPHAAQPLAKECHYALCVLATTCAHVLTARALRAILDDVQGVVDSCDALVGQDDIRLATVALYDTAREMQGNRWCDAPKFFRATRDSLRGWTGEGAMCCARANYMAVERVVITPLRILCLVPEVVQMSRLLRRLAATRRVVLVQFRDEQRQLMRGADLRPRIEAVMETGFTLGGARFEFLVASGSQMRTQGALFVEVYGDRCVETIRSEILDVAAFTSVASYASRLGLFATADTPTVCIRPDECFEVPDITSANGDLLTDGVGKLRLSTAQQVASHLGLDHVPSAFQFRFAGMKGVALVVGDDDPQMMHAGAHVQFLYRPSMRKFASLDEYFCVVEYATAHPLHLNREIITLLSARQAEAFHPGVQFQRMLDQTLADLVGMFADPQTDMAIAPPLDRILPRVRQVFDLTADHFYLHLLRTIHRQSIQQLVLKMRLPVEHGVLLLGAADPLGVLGENEVFACLADRIILGPAIVYRNPCLHPGDVRLVCCVDHPQLRGFTNVLLFPLRGQRSIPADCSGGDLDGDKFALIWDPALVPGDAEEPLEYSALATHGERVEEDNMSGECPPEKLAAYYSRVFVSDVLGQVATMHLALSDVLEKGANDSLARKLAESQSVAVDFPKTGVFPEVPVEAGKRLKVTGYPDFMGHRYKKKSYNSAKILGALYRQALSFDFKFNPLVLPLDMQLVVPGSEVFLERAQRDYAAFALGMRRLLWCYGLETEGELLLGVAPRWAPCHAAMKGTAQHGLRTSVALALDHWRQHFLNRPVADYVPTASAWYQVAYQQPRRDPEPVFYCFAWVAGDILCDVKSACASTSERSLGTVGAGVVQLLEKDWAVVQQAVSDRTAVASQLRSALDRWCAARRIPSMAMDVFGSTATYLCTPLSDVDVVVHVPEEARNALNIHSQTLEEQQRFVLSDTVAPAIDSIALQKELILDARVPLVRARIRGSQISVDISCMNSTALGKTQHLLDAFRQVSVFALTNLCLRWARAAELLQESDKSASIVSTNELHALCLHLARTPGLRCLDPPVACVESAGHLADLLSATNPHRLGRLLVDFFKTLSELTCAVVYRWPDGGTTTLDVAVVRLLAEHAHFAWHYLMVTQDVSEWLAQTAHKAHGAQDVDVTRRLPPALTYYIGGALAFQSTRLSRLSGAKVTLSDVGRSRLLLRVVGSPKAAQRVHELLVALQASRGHSLSKPARYFMENATAFLFCDAESQDAQVTFVDALSSPYHRKHEAFARSIAVLRTIGNGRERALARFVEIWMQQVMLIPATLRDEIRVHTRIGTLYFVDAAAVLPDTSPSISIQQLERAIVKNKRSRKEWWRAEPHLTAEPHHTAKPEDHSNPSHETQQVRPSATAGIRKKRKRDWGQRWRGRSLTSSFCPGLGMPPASCERVYERALAGWAEEDGQSGPSYRITIGASASYELRMRADADLERTELTERPLNWASISVCDDDVHFRVTVRTKDVVEPGSDLYRFACPTSRAPICATDHAVSFRPGIADRLRGRIAHVRRIDAARTFAHPVEASVAGSIVYGAEFEGANLEVRRDFCEACLRFNLEPVRQAHYARRAWEKFAMQVWEISHTFRNAIMQSSVGVQ